MFKNLDNLLLGTSYSLLLMKLKNIKKNAWVGTNKK